MRKKQDTGDKRAYHLFPTEKAAQAYNTIIEEENRLTKQCYAGFNKNQQETVLTLIRNMRQNIEDDWYTLKRYR